MNTATQMFLRKWWLLSLLSCAILLGGCTTTLSSSPASQGKVGLRYSLPAPHVILTPQSDGTIKVEVKNFSDPNNTYTVDMESYLSKATFQVTTQDGMLKTVSLDADSSALASGSISAATDIQKAKMDAADTEKKAAKDKADAKAAAIKKANEDIQAQEEKVALLKEKSKFYESHTANYPEKDRLDLNLEIEQEQIKLNQMEARLGLIKDKGSNAYNDPNAEIGQDITTAYGPVLFRVLPDEKNPDGVKLVALEKQATYKTSLSAKVPAPPKQKPKFDKSRILVKKADENKDIVVTYSSPIMIDQVRSGLFNPADGVKAKSVIAGKDLHIGVVTKEGATTITIVLSKEFPKGNYQLNLVFNLEGEQPQQESIEIDWLNE